MNAPRGITVLVADDQEMIREGLIVLLNAQPDIEVIGAAVDGQDAVQQAAALHPDVVLMDVRMPVLNGLEAARRILDAPAHRPAGDQPGPRVLVLTTFDHDEYVYEALRAGASGFLLKNASAHALADAVRIVAAGDALLAPSITRRLIAEFSRLGPPHGLDRRRLDHLTERETEVLALVARGLSNAEIAAHLVVAEQTIKTHIGRILAKLNLRDRTQAAIYAYDTGLIQPNP